MRNTYRQPNHFVASFLGQYHRNLQLCPSLCPVKRLDESELIHNHHDNAQRNDNEDRNNGFNPVQSHSPRLRAALGTAVLKRHS